MQTLQADYFAAYRSLNLSRDAKGVLVAEFHSDGGPFIMNAQAHTECTIAARVKVLAARDKRRCLRAPAPLAVMANFILADDFKRERLGKQAPSQSLPKTVNPADCRSRARPQVS